MASLVTGHGATTSEPAGAAENALRRTGEPMEGIEQLNGTYPMDLDPDHVGNRQAVIRQAARHGTAARHRLHAGRGHLPGQRA